MATLTAAMRKFISENLCLVATVNKDWRPNVAPKGTFRVLDEKTLAYAEIYGELTYQNLLANPYVCVVAVNRQERAMVRCSGRAEIVTTGPLYDEMAAQVEKKGLPRPQAVVKIAIEEVRTLRV